MRTFAFRFFLFLAAAAAVPGAGWADGRKFAYTGRMDADTITVSSQSTGLIDSLPIAEGDAVRKGQTLCRINIDRLLAQRRQQGAQVAELAVRSAVAQAQVQQAEAQIKQAEAQIQQAQAQLDYTQATLARTEKVLAEGGATQQSRDLLATQASVDKANLAAAQSNYLAAQSNALALQSSAKLIPAQEEQLKAAVQLTDLAIREATAVSPIDGVVLNTFHHPGELASVGTPLFELADLSVLTVQIYVPLAQLGSFSLGTPAAVSADGVGKTLRGTVYWISSESEFTPKTILTQETRTTLVYGVKIRVANPDCILKIGMPVEVRF
ncbi:MAG: HlyD family secretion protein [Spirochaetia bacterium]